MPNERVNLVRPDGSILQVSRQDADRLQQLGSDLQEESLGSNIARNREEGIREYYEDQKLETFVEGAASGLTLGASDLLTEEVFGWDTAERAQYNPGTRLAGEIVGGIAPVLAGAGGASLLAKTPAGILSVGAAKVGARAGGSAARQMAVAGAVEGAALGVAAEGVNATLSGDPLTAEAIIAGIGWGGVLGGGIGAAVGKVGSVAGDMAKARAAEAARHTFPEMEFNAFRSAVGDATKVIDDAIKTTETRVAAAVKAGSDPAQVAQDLSEALTLRKEMHKSLLDELTADGSIAKAKTVRDAMLADYNTVAKAAAAGDVKAFESAMESHAVRMERLQRAVGREPAVVEAFRYKPVGQGTDSALEELKDLALVRDTLKNMPMTGEGLSVVKEKSIQFQVDAIDKLMSTGGAELEGVRQSVKESLQRAAEATGVTVQGTPGEQLRTLWELTRAHRTKAGQEAVGQTLAGRVFSGTARYAGGKGAVVATGVAAPAAKIGVYAMGAAAVTGLIGLRKAVTGSLSDSIARWAPRIQRGSEVARKTGLPARVDPLRTRLDGTVDQEKKSRKELMKERAEEFASNAQTLRSTLYRSLEGLAVNHPQFVSAVMDTADKQFQAMAGRVPRDPGTQIARMKSMWKPDDVAVEKFARAYEVFQNPVAVANRALETGDISVEAARALRELNPEIFQQLRVGMLEKLSDPEVTSQLTYAEQVSLGRLLDITIHSTQTPRFIAAQQQMFRERNEPLAVRPPGGSTSNNPSGGRPPGVSASQAITQH